MKPERREIIIHPRTRKWQWLAVFSGLLLTACIFMPTFGWLLYFDWGPVSPLEYLCRSFDYSGRSDRYPALVEVFSLNVDVQKYASVHVLGLFVALGALGRLWRKRSLKTAASGFLLLLLLSYCLLSPLTILTAYLYPDYPPRLDVAGFLRNPLGSATLRESVLAPALALVYVGLSLRRGEQGHLCRVFLASLWVFIFFAWTVGQWFPVPGELYGGYVALAAAGLLLVATIGEAAAAAGQSWVQTIVQLLICRPPPPMDMRGRCPGCTYQLYGLSQMRCPECGREFTLEEIHISASELTLPRPPCVT
ncbi:MAG: hypothetical protein GX616_06705 [Planctomycetes bacterium]|nr:hypothetical protein [Planctomycetota bacterium]